MAGPQPGSAELPITARCALGRHRSRAGALPRGYFDHAAVRMAAPEVGAVGSESRVAAGAAPAAKGLGGAWGGGAVAAAVLAAAELEEGPMGVVGAREAAATAAAATAAVVLAAVRAARAAEMVAALEGRLASALRQTGRPRRG